MKAGRSPGVAESSGAVAQPEVMVGDGAPVTSVDRGRSPGGSEGASGSRGSDAAKNLRVRARSAGMAFLAGSGDAATAATRRAPAADVSWGAPEATASPAGPASRVPNELAGRRPLLTAGHREESRRWGKVEHAHVYPRRFDLSIVPKGRKPYWDESDHLSAARISASWRSRVRLVS